ncbi:DMT family transporter [Pseudomonas trivialis]|uniref:Membrane protein n=1 Tax=Pseudomonas trivialis TaxID=200450 RepID=A0A0R2ZGU1_9PSED|nr:DMT family transporter [Pseudomonas trivialis]KRP60010.1 membrane protein [Pseudomonas trivialis]SDS65198.1 Permease of the drug/metabolite transporter (DMT) superfamily [Pseudomonas trivialis]
MRKPVDGAATAVMILLCLIWGAQQVAIKAVAHDIAPVMQVAVRSGVAALLVWLIGKWIMREQWLPSVWYRSGLVVAVLFAAEFLFVAQGLRWTSASHMAVFLYTAPLFAAIGLHLRLPEERLGALQWLGMSLAFAGIAITFLMPRDGVATQLAITDSLLGDLLGLCAGAAWGFTTVAVRTSRLSEAPPTQTLFYQLAGAFILLLPVSLLPGQNAVTFSTNAVASLIFQTVIVSVASYLIWFWMLRRYLAARLGVLAFMSPLFGVLMGHLWLGEQTSFGFLLGASLTIVGLLVVNLSKASVQNQEERSYLRR